MGQSHFFHILLGNTYKAVFPVNRHCFNFFVTFTSFKVFPAVSLLLLQKNEPASENLGGKKFQILLFLRIAVIVSLCRLRRLLISCFDNPKCLLSLMNQRQNKVTDKNVISGDRWGGWEFKLLIFTNRHEQLIKTQKFGSLPYHFLTYCRAVYTFLAVN